MVLYRAAESLLLFLGNCSSEDNCPQTARTLEPSWSGSCSVGGSDEEAAPLGLRCRAPKDEGIRPGDLIFASAALLNGGWVEPCSVEPALSTESATLPCRPAVWTTK